MMYYPAPKMRQLFVIVLFIQVFSAKAQPDALRLTLASALQMGLENRTELQNEKINIAILENELDKVNSRRLPQINASFDARINTQLQATVIPAGVFGQTEKVVQFGVPFNDLLSAGITQSIYSPSLRTDRAIAETRTKLGQENQLKISADIKYAVAQAYYNVLLWQARTQAAAYNLSQAKITHKKAQADYDYGKLLKTDLQRKLLELQNSQNAYNASQRSQQNAAEYLAQQIGVSFATKITLLDSLTQATQASPNGSNYRPELTAEANALKINELLLLKQQKSYLPTINAYGNYGLQHINNQFNPFEKNTWFQVSYLGVRAEMPIFNGFLKQKNVQEYKLRTQINQNRIQQLENDFGYEISSAKAEIGSALESLSQTQASYELAQKIIETDSFRLQKGVIIPAELENTKNAAQTAQTNYLNAIYVLLNAKLKLQKAEGNL